MTSNLLELMNNIVNVRNYQKKSISEKTLQTLYEAFSYGPASVSTQARELLVINSKKQRQKVIAATLDPYMTENSYGAQSWLLDVPFVGVIIIEKRRALARVGDIGLSIAKLESASAIQNFRLLAQYEGISTACVWEFDRGRLKENLNLPWYTLPVAILTAGYPSEKVDNPPRFSNEELISYEKWS